MSKKRRGRGEGSISYREDRGLWCARISLGIGPDGKLQRKAVYGETKGEVQDKLRKIQESASLGDLGNADRLTLSAFLDSWLEQVKSQVCPTTYRRYEQHVNRHLKPILGPAKMSQLSPLHVSKLYKEMEKKGDSASERHKVGTALRMALKHACRIRLLRHNVADDIPKPRVSKEEIRPLAREQVGVFLNSAEEDRYHAAYVLALDSGMRQGELFGLHWPEVNFNTGTVRVIRSLEELNGYQRLKDVKTKTSRRTIKLTARTIAALNNHRQKMLAEGRDVKAGPVFLNADGGMVFKSSFRTWSFLKVLKKADLLDESGRQLIRFHDLRHTCATLLLAAGENVKVVSERLGHSSVKITLDTYAHVMPGMQDAAVEKMARILGTRIA
jgi:integrase